MLEGDVLTNSTVDAWIAGHLETICRAAEAGRLNICIISNAYFCIIRSWFRQKDIGSSTAQRVDRQLTLEESRRPAEGRGRYYLETVSPFIINYGIDSYSCKIEWIFCKLHHMLISYRYFLELNHSFYCICGFFFFLYWKNIFCIFVLREK